jgi:glycine cleavage system regulatory protein
VNEKNQQLQRQAEEKEAQARRDREITDQLTKQLGESLKTQASLEKMQTQTSMMLKMLGEQRDDHALDVLAQEDSKVKIENIADDVKALSAQLMPQGDAVSILGNKQVEGISK